MRLIIALAPERQRPMGLPKSPISKTPRVLIPNPHRAIIDSRKLTEYCLSPDHPVGGHKAILFERVLGITEEHADAFQEILLYVAAHASAAAGRLDEFGQRYTIDFTLGTPVGTAAVRSAWIVRPLEDFVRLTTCFVLPL